MLGKWLPTIKFAVGAGVLALALITARQWMADQREMRDALIVSNAEKVSAQAQAQTLENANQLLQDSLEIQRQSLLRAQERLDALNVEFNEFRRTREEQENVFDEHDLQNLMNARPSTIERLANAATQDRFNEFEAVIND